MLIAVSALPFPSSSLIQCVNQNLGAILSSLNTDFRNRGYSASGARSEAQPQLSGRPGMIKGEVGHLLTQVTR